MKRCEHLMNAGKKIDVDRAQPALLYVVGCLSLAQLECFVGTDVQKRPWVNFRQLIEPLRDELHRSRLTRRQHSAIRNLSQRRVLLPRQNLVQVAERFLLRNDRQVIFLRVLHQRFRVFRRNRTAGQRWQRRSRVQADAAGSAEYSQSDS